MSESRFPFDLDAEDERVLAALSELMRLGDTMPQEVAEAARGLHDWARADAILAELVATERELTRDDGGVLTWATRDVEIRVEVRAAGFRRRQLTLMGTGCDGPVAVELSLQTFRGQSIPLPLDDLGEATARVPAGAVRVHARTTTTAAVTPWFTV